jgi:CHASE1-domain containing sensor protein
LILPAIFLSLGLAATLGSYVITKRILEKEKLIIFNQQAIQIEDEIEERVFAHIVNLRSLQALWNGSDGGVTNEEFSRYLDFTNLIYQFPGISSVVYAKYLAPPADPEALGEVRVEYIYPLEGKESALRIDMTTRPERLPAFTLARDKGEIITSQKTILTTTGRPGFLLIAPLYNGATIPNSVAERRSDLSGFIIFVFRDTDLFNAIFGPANPFPDLNFSIYHNGMIDHDHLLYNSDYSQQAPDWNDHYQPFQVKKHLNIGNNAWTLVVTAKPSFGLKPAEEFLPKMTLLIGLPLLSFFALAVWRVYSKYLKI